MAEDSYRLWLYKINNPNRDYRYLISNRMGNEDRLSAVDLVAYFEGVEEELLGDFYLTVMRYEGERQGLIDVLEKKLKDKNPNGIVFLRD